MLALVGAGAFATSVHLPNLERLKGKFRIYAIMRKTPHKAKAWRQIRCPLCDLQFGRPLER